MYPSRFHGINKDVHVCAIPEDPDDNELSQEDDDDVDETFNPESEYNRDSGKFT